jgi:hypothetical protein
MKRFRSILGAVFTALLWIYAILRAALDWMGRGELFDDPQKAKDLVVRGINWLFSTPWWVASLLALIATLFLFWPRVEEIVAYLEKPLPAPPPGVPASWRRSRWWYAIWARSPIFNEHAQRQVRLIDSWDEFLKKQAETPSADEVDKI